MGNQNSAPTKFQGKAGGAPPEEEEKNAPEPASVFVPRDLQGIIDPCPMIEQLRIHLHLYAPVGDDLSIVRFTTRRKREVAIYDFAVLEFASIGKNICHLIGQYLFEMFGGTIEGWGAQITEQLRKRRLNQSVSWSAEERSGTHLCEIKGGPSSSSMQEGGEPHNRSAPKVASIVHTELKWWDPAAKVDAMVQEVVLQQQPDTEIPTPHPERNQLMVAHLGIIVPQACDLKHWINEITGNVQMRLQGSKSTALRMPFTMLSNEGIPSAAAWMLEPVETVRKQVEGLPLAVSAETARNSYFNGLQIRQSERQADATVTISNGWSEGHDEMLLNETAGPAATEGSKLFWSRRMHPEDLSKNFVRNIGALAAAGATAAYSMGGPEAIKRKAIGLVSKELETEKSKIAEAGRVLMHISKIQEKAAAGNPQWQQPNGEKARAEYLYNALSNASEDIELALEIEPAESLSPMQLLQGAKSVPGEERKPLSLETPAEMSEPASTK